MAIRRKTLSDEGVAALKAKPKRYTHPDPELRGHYVRVMPSGAKSFVAVSRDPNGLQKWATIGAADMMDIETARDGARDAIKRIRAGLPAVEEKAAPTTFRAVAESYLKRHVEAKGLVSEKEIKRCLNVYVFPKWEKRVFTTIRRGDLSTLLDQIQDDHGARQADLVLAIVRSICNWYAARNDDYVSPVVRGMRRAAPVKRDRILSDGEIKAIWDEAPNHGTFGAILRFALVTAQRREKVMTIRWDAVSVDGIWTVPSDDREKGTGGDLKLSDLALDVIRGRQRVGDNPYIFAGRLKDGYFNGMSKAKVAFDEKVPLPHWTPHDLRRTARSLMARAGVSSETAERVMGHAIDGVEGVYNRHQYVTEKADALARLGALIKSIIDPPAGNVLPMRRRGRK